jgi:transcriptional regulator with XRE-family HTH domain
VTLGHRIQILRAGVRMKGQDLAEKLGINPQHLSQIENDHRLPSFDRIKQMAKIFDLSLSRFFEDVENT